MIRLWHAPDARSLRVLWMLEELGLEYDLHLVDFFDGSMRAPEFLALSPAGRVPAVEIDGEVLTESGAILEVLAERHAAAGLHRAPDHPERAKYLEYLHFGETIGQHLANLTQSHIVLREDWMRSATVIKLETRRLQKVLEAVAQVVAAGGWLLPSGFSAADISVGYGVWLARRFVAVGAVPGADAYRTRLEARPGFQRALAANGPAQIYTRDFYEVPDG